MTPFCTPTGGIENLANVLLATSWKVDGKNINLSRLGWTFKFNNKKTAFGTCSYKLKTIYLSKYRLENNFEHMDIWEDTIKHEIAHAIDCERRGKSDHGDIWKSIAVQVGCVPERCLKGEVLVVKDKKYTLKCNNCGFEKDIHKKKRKRVACKSCCTQHNDGKFCEDYVLDVVTNF